MINPSSKYFKSEVARTLKKAGIEFAILEKKYTFPDWVLHIVIISTN